MRTLTESGITFTYPDAIALAGNRNIITVSGATTYETYKVYLITTVPVGETVERVYTLLETRDLIEGAGEVNVSAYFLELFENEGKNEKFAPKVTGISFTFDEETATYDFDFTTILYGKNKIFDVEKVPFFAEYTDYSKWFEFYLKEPTLGIVDGSTERIFDAGVNIFDLTPYSGDVIIDFSSTFDETFDYTFQSGLNKITIQKVSCPENGILLRWLDHLGIWQQKTFSKIISKNTGKGNAYKWNLQPNDVYYSGLKFIEKTSQNSLDIQAQYCTLEEAERLSDLCLSDFVHVYDFATSVWLPCLIGTTSVAIDFTKNAQTLNFNLILQDEY